MRMLWKQYIFWMALPEAERNVPHFVKGHFEYIFVNKRAPALIKISLKFAHNGANNNNPSLIQLVVACRYMI